ncbi:SDR family NAD(P)-dependent oxidoreductase [Cellulomonas chengniuliangii]|uniref:SDR family NAD(P)-dependent oxidoreductase n=1 Tax=Cellulomonas chengniuliangii TaxID=2968084 RepID=A0ABY5L4H5_9CELL|nr:SDR family NAD(P)-dependent oxidoreductase [Cellulomonas chengniuliangii]MCC2308321.1 SDR family NAD(P)-dependent oxidoreductase [Cellulomonas chengniuliangii]UUI76704.1 SDR family NAD(P)-dependent oxidoreductase [Cellulomonas chengniuliangii]
MTDQTTPQDPTSQYPQPGQPAEKIEHPGRTSDMAQKPDHGEDTYRGSGRLEGRRALITGGDSGIGRAVAIAFAREGADVAISYLPEEEPDAQETVRLIEAAGRRALAVPGDIRDEAHCVDLVEHVAREFAGLDILVNNAAYQMSQAGGLRDITTEQLDRVLKTNLYAMFWITRAALPHLGAGASIINTTSIQAYDPSPQLLDYATTKAGILNFTRGLSQQLAEEGIRVNLPERGRLRPSQSQPVHMGRGAPEVRHAQAQAAAGLRRGDLVLLDELQRGAGRQHEHRRAVVRLHRLQVEQALVPEGGGGQVGDHDPHDHLDKLHSAPSARHGGLTGTARSAGPAPLAGRARRRGRT